jgi:putative transcriptional regulator
MNTIKAIRKRLGVTQEALAVEMGCTQGNIGHYERGQTVPPEAAKRLITFAQSLGHSITFNDIYMPELAKAPASPAQAATESIAVEAAPVNALRAGRVRRLAERRLQRQRGDGDRRGINLSQLNVAGEA